MSKRPLTTSRRGIERVGCLPGKPWQYEALDCVLLPHPQAAGVAQGSGAASPSPTRPWRGARHCAKMVQLGRSTSFNPTPQAPSHTADPRFAARP